MANMSDWIDKKAEEERKKRERGEKREEWRLHEATEVGARGPELFLQLEDIVKCDVAKWNDAFKDDQWQIEAVEPTPPNGFRLRKRSFPSATMQVSFDSNAMEIAVNIESERMRGGGVYPRKGSFPMKLSKEGNAIYFTASSGGHHWSLEQVSQILIENLVGDSSPIQPL
jgi:hypothetical protein